jgi:hypothetical protein
MGDRRGAYMVLVGRPKGNLEDLGVGRRFILKMIFKKWDRTEWTGWI